MEPWNATIRAINVACEYASRQLKVPMKGLHFASDIYFQRRVFEKVSSAIQCITAGILSCEKCTGKNQDALSFIDPADDPKNTYRKIQDSWNVCSALPIGEISTGDRLLALDKLLLTRGDFVEVGAEIDFVVGRDRTSRPILRAYLACTHVTRLLPAKKAEKLTKVRIPSNLKIKIKMFTFTQRNIDGGTLKRGREAGEVFYARKKQHITTNFEAIV